MTHASLITRTVLAATTTMLLAACGSTASPASSPSAAPTATAAPATVMTAQKTVGGSAKVVLTDPHGLTLYWFKPDTATTVACTGGCASAWPPLKAPAGTLTPGAGVTGTLTAIDGPNGRQVLYNGHPLYLYSKDQDRSDVYGNGIGGVWFAATPDLQAAAS